MYPSGELTKLAARKTLLQARIAVRRWECAVAAAELARPIALVDRGLELWKRFAPLVGLLGLPATFLFARKMKRGIGSKARLGGGRIGMILRFLPLVLRSLKTIMALRATSTARRSHAPVVGGRR